jgi:nucleoid DNA-binding protein
MYASKDTTAIATRIRELPLPYNLKRYLIRPVLMGLRKTVLEQGKVSIKDLGVFIVEKKKVPIGVGKVGRQEKMVLRFHPSKKLAKEVMDKWNNPVVGLVDNALPLDSASSAATIGQEDCSASVVGVPGVTFTT